MPTLSVKRSLLNAALGRNYSDEEFDELCFEYGVELDDVTSEREEYEKSLPPGAVADPVELSARSAEVVYKIDLPANRYDLLCIEGLSRALRIFSGDDAEAPVVRRVPGPHSMVVDCASASTIRPYVVCGILRGVSFTPERYDSFIDLQDQLHRNLCRNRTLVAIGTHDLGSVDASGPFRFGAEDPGLVNFVPLTHPDGTSFRSDRLLEHYATDPSCKHLKPYVPIIVDSPLYPVVRDCAGNVLSLPPIINGHRSRITLDTTDVFIECTATDLTKANVVLDTVVCMFSQYCADPFVVEAVEIRYDGAPPSDVPGGTSTTPLLSTRTVQASVATIASTIGAPISPADAVRLCRKVQLSPATADGDVLTCTVGPVRSDVLHPIDVAEDIGIAYGFNNIVRKVPATSTVGGEQGINALGDLLREEISRAGYTEVLTHGLTSLADNYTSLRRPVGTDAVHLSNPANVEYEVVRTTLLPGLMKTLQHNRSASFANGMKLFEVSDVVVADNTHVCTETIVGAKNIRKICAVYAGLTSGFEILHGLVDRIMTLCEVGPEPEYVATSRDDEGKFRVAREGWAYTVEEHAGDGEEGGTYFPGRGAVVLLSNPALGKRVRVGHFGVLHPEVLTNFDVAYPTSAMELDLEVLM